MATEKRLIDADAEIEAVKKYACKDCESYDGIRCRACWADDLMNWIADAPKVDAVEVVHGDWLYDSGTDRYFCSVCNENALHSIIDEPVYDYDWEENLRFSHIDTIINEYLTNYCPNCGAKMDGGETDGT